MPSLQVFLQLWDFVSVLIYVHSLVCANLCYITCLCIVIGLAAYFRFQFCSTTSLCCSWKLKGPCSWTCFYCFSCDGIHAEAGSVSHSRPYPVSSASFHFNIICWPLSSFSWNPKVIRIISPFHIMQFLIIIIVNLKNYKNEESF